MLTQLRLKNWRSIADETINFTKLTVFIGANSSGKTNILDALHFIRRVVTAGSVAIYNWQGLEKIRTLGAESDRSLELEAILQLNGATDLWYREIISPNFPSSVIQSIGQGDELFKIEIPMFAPLQGLSEEESHQRNLAETAFSYMKQRWQLLRENMTPPVALPSTNELSDPYLIDPLAQNVPFMLDFMQQFKSDVYEELQNDFRLLLDHVEEFETVRDEREIRVFIHEKFLKGHESPTISAGTSRLLAILTAYYALDLRDADQPGLVVIEEPDTAVHPMLLGKLVDLLRSYTQRDEPRQFILTTHNPQMLNYFEPEEVRVVERDEDTGETWVEEVPEDLKETWLQKHRLGDAWMSRIIGGIPE